LKRRLRLLGVTSTDKSYRVEQEKYYHSGWGCGTENGAVNPLEQSILAFYHFAIISGKIIFV